MKKSRTQNKCSVKWDYDTGPKVPYQAVNYGEELYEHAAQNLAKSLQQRACEERKSAPVEEVEDNCFDFSKPGVNSSRYESKALERAIRNLQVLPEQMETMLRKDERFQPTIMNKATKSLNVSRNARVYKNLIPLDPNPNVRTETENLIQAEIKKSIEAARQPSRNRDPEPRLEDFQANSYTRMRPSAVPIPPKPTSGISFPTNNDFDTIQDERHLEDESNRFET